MKCIGVIFVFCLAAMYARSQPGKVVHLSILDATDSLAISKAHISSVNKTYVTDRNGIVRLPLNIGSRISISHISYPDTSLLITESQHAYTLYLTPLVHSLSTVSINGKPYEIFSPEETHVFDYDFMGDTLLALTYERQKMMRRAEFQSREMYLGCRLVVVSPSGSILFTKHLSHLISGFYRDGLNQLFILGDNTAELVSIDSFGPILTQVDMTLFDEQIKPLKASSSTAYFYDDQSWDYPEFTHYQKSKENGESKSLRTVRDDFTMELFRASYKYMGNRDKLKAIRLETETGIDKEIFGAYMSGFQHSLYYEPIYAPLFQLGDTTAIFDHHNAFIFFHDDHGKALDSIPMSYCEKEAGKFDKQLIQCRDGQDIYAMYKKSGRKYLRQVNLENGSAEEKIELYYPYPEHIKVVKDRVYYIYRKNDGKSTKHLFAEDLYE